MKPTGREMLNAPMTLEHARPVEIKPMPQPSLLENVVNTTAAAFRLNNEVASYLSREPGLPPRRYWVDPKFDVWSLIPKDKLEYAGLYGDATTPEEVNAVTRHIDRLNTDNDTMARAGMLGMVPALFAGLLSPMNLIPTGGVAWKTYRTGGSILKGALTTAAVAAGSVAASEALLHETQLTRDWGESAANVAGATFLGGVVGLGVGALGSKLALRDARKLMEKAAQHIDQELKVPQYGQYSKAALGEQLKTYDEATEELLGLQKKGVAPEAPEYIQAALKKQEAKDRWEVMTQSVDEVDPTEPGAVTIPDMALEHDTGHTGILFDTAPEEALSKGFMATDKGKVELFPGQRRGITATQAIFDNELIQDHGVLSKFPSFDPLTQSIFSPSLETRRITQDLIQVPVRYEKNSKWMPTSIPVETIAAQGKGKLYSAFKGMDEQYVQYRKSLLGKGGEPLSKDDFKDAVGRAMFNNDEHFIPEVQAVARQMRRDVFDPLKERAIALGALPADVDAKTAQSYMMTLRDVDKIKARRPEYFKLNLDWLTEKENRMASKASDIRERILKAYGEHGADTEKWGDDIAAHFFDELGGDMERIKKFKYEPRTQVALEDIVNQLIDRITGLPAGRLGYDLLHGAQAELLEVAGHRGVAPDNPGLHLNQKELTQQRRAAKLTLDPVEQALLDKEIEKGVRVKRDVKAKQSKRIDAYQALADDTPGTGLSKGTGKPLKTKLYDLPWEGEQNFLIHDIEHLAKVYERTMSTDLALMEKFGTTDLDAALEGLKLRIARDWDKKLNGEMTEKQRKHLTDLRDRDISNLDAMWQRQRGTYALPSDPSAVHVRAGKAVRTFNNLTLMMGAVVASIPDLARPMMVHGLGRFLKDGLVPLMKDFKAVRLSGHETQLASTALDMVLDSRALSLVDMVDDYGRGSKFERILQGVNERYGKISGLSQWTSAMKQFSGLITQSRILEACDTAVAGKISKKEITNLAQAYIGEDMAKRIAAQYAKHGEARGGVKLPNTMNWTDNEARNVFRYALQKEVDRIIVTPGQEKPLWFSTELGKLIFQYQSFFMSSTQRVLMSGLQDRDLGVLHGMTFAVGLGTIAAMLKAKLARRELPENPAQLILEGVDNAGIMGWLFDANNIAEKLTRGHLGFSAMMGKQPMSRYASRGIIDALLGPTVGGVVAGAKVTAAAASQQWQQSDVRALRRLTPFQNLWYLRWLFDAAEDSLSQHLPRKIQ